MKRILLLVSLALVLPAFTPLSDAIAAEENAKKKETRRVPALTERTYKILSKATLMIDPDSVQVEEGKTPPEPEGTPADAVELLLEAVNKRGVNSYEAAQLWNTLAFAYYVLEDTKNTIFAYEKVLEQEKITEALELAALRSLYQLYFAGEDYRKSLVYMDRWEILKGEVDPNVTFLKANAYYQLKEWENSLRESLLVEQQAIEQAKPVKENWLYLQVVLYSELKDIDNTILVLEKLIVAYPKKQYWMHLAGMYSEKEMDDRALSAYHAAYTQGLLTRPSEIVMLAQRLLSQEVPHEGAMVLESALKQDLVPANERNLKLLAQAHSMAKNASMAIDAWERAADAGEGGQNYYRLAQSLASQDRHKEAVEAFEKALDKGVNDDSDAHFWMGVSLMQIERWDAATKEFRAASKDADQRMKKSCSQYIRYIASEKRRQEALKEMLES